MMLANRVDVSQMFPYHHGAFAAVAAAERTAALFAVAAQEVDSDAVRDILRAQQSALQEQPAYKGVEERAAYLQEQPLDSRRRRAYFTLGWEALRTTRDLSARASYLKREEVAKRVEGTELRLSGRLVTWPAEIQGMSQGARTFLEVVRPDEAGQPDEVCVFGITLSVGYAARGLRKAYTAQSPDAWPRQIVARQDDRTGPRPAPSLQVMGADLLAVYRVMDTLLAVETHFPPGDASAAVRHHRRR